ncbi:Hypothetical protein CPI37_0469 [Corynebacterium pseudotuberculosis]|nr:Hypothetical protein CPI37_0469 [Corynebacterium pseudotuberculosis]
MLRQINMVKHVNFDWQMPRDPFADDPNDPASFLDEDEPLPPLSEAEKRHIEEDLRLVQRFKKSPTAPWHQRNFLPLRRLQRGTLLRLGHHDGKHPCHSQRRAQPSPRAKSQSQPPGLCSLGLLLRISGRARGSPLLLTAAPL